MALKEIMEDFVKYKEQLDDMDRNGTESSTVEIYEKQFMRLRDITLRYKLDGLCTTVEGEKRCNNSRNRYKDIVPYDHSRVIMSEPSGDPPSDYINASYIQGVTPGDVYIACQGPMPDTVVDFWKMLWENSVKIVVMACNEYEGNPRRLRCQRYWATDVDETLEIGDISVTMVKEQKGNYSEYVIRHLKATRGAETREVTHLHYVEFPDRGIPKCVPSLLDMIELMRELQPANSPDAPPLAVHCSAGCGRTGTIIVIDYIWNMLKFGRVKQDFSVFDVISEMRKQRMAIVQSLEQYVCVHEAVVVMFQRQLELMQDHCDYYNIAPKHSVPDTSANDYEMIPIIICEPDVDKDRQTSTKRDSPPTPSAKPRSPMRPEPPRRPVAGRFPALTDDKPSSSDQNQSIAIYATPFGRPPVVVVKKPTETATQTPKLPPAAKFGEFPSEVGSPKSTGSPLYSELDSPPPPASPANGTTSPQSASSYEYADPNATGKWSLQHIARRPPVECEYATIPATYGDGSYSPTDACPDKVAESPYSSADVDEPLYSQPMRHASSTSADSAAGVTPGPAFAAKAARIKNLFTKPAPDISSFASTGQPVQVFFRGIDISYPNRVPRPKYGKRPLKLLTVK